VQEQSNCDSCDKEDCSAKRRNAEESLEAYVERQALQQAMCRIRHKILVLSGKGGVGKSTVAANMAVALSEAGRKVGLLDIDIHGPSIPKLLNLEEERPASRGDKIVPVQFDGNLKVMSIGFLLRGADDAVIWRGPLKMGVIKQFLKDVEWGELDFLVVDSPPGTGDEPLSICQLVENPTGAVIVTTPQELSVIDVRKCITFCRKLNVPVLGVIENMSGFVCPNCGEVCEIFKSGGGEKMAKEMGVPFLGRIPIDRGLVDSCDTGKPFVRDYEGSEAHKAFAGAMASILAVDRPSPDVKKGEGMGSRIRVAIPLAAGKMSMHFGHCEQFALLDVDPESKEILGKEVVDAPEHEPGLLPRWLSEHGASLIIAGGMGRRAQDLFAQQNIEVVIGAPRLEPEQLVMDYLNGKLKVGENICDH